VQIAYKITADGSNITDLVADRLLSCQITDQAGVKSDRLTLAIDDRDQRLEIPETGAEIQVWLGYAGQTLVNMGKFTVDEVDVSGPAREMTIRANAADMTGEIKSPKERSWDGVSLGDVVRKIASEHRLTPAISAELAAVQLGHIDQTESDMQLLTRLCSDQGATCKVADGRLVVAKRASGKSTGGSDLPVAAIDAGDCDDWSASIAERGKYKTVIAQWHDLKTGKRSEERAGSGKPELTLKHTYQSKDAASRAAKSKVEAMTRSGSKIQINGLVGNPNMSAEMQANLTGFRAGIDGDGWIINSVTHSFTSSGYTCGLELEQKQ
jgi:phage protein D